MRNLVAVKLTCPLQQWHRGMGMAEIAQLEKITHSRRPLLCCAAEPTTHMQQWRSLLLQQAAHLTTQRSCLTLSPRWRCHFAGRLGSRQRLVRRHQRPLPDLACSMCVDPSPQCQMYDRLPTPGGQWHDLQGRQQSTVSRKQVGGRTAATAHECRRSGWVEVCTRLQQIHCKVDRSNWTAQQPGKQATEVHIAGKAKFRDGQHKNMPQ